MLRALLVISLLIVSSFAYGQEYAKVTVGTNIGFNQAHVDVKKRKLGYTGSLHADYQFSDYVSVGVQGQVGKILGGDQFTDPRMRQFTNKYKSVAFLLNVQLGALTGYAASETLIALNKIYFGIGAGLIANNIVNIIRIQPDGSNYRFPGVDKGMNLTVPVVLGINVPVKGHDEETPFSINFNVQRNVTFGEGLDGYNDNSDIFENKSPDFSTVFFVGIR